jgi:hypothetical protein
MKCFHHALYFINKWQVKEGFMLALVFSGIRVARSLIKEGLMLALVFSGVRVARSLVKEGFMLTLVFRGYH